MIATIAWAAAGLFMGAGLGLSMAYWIKARRDLREMETRLVFKRGDPALDDFRGTASRKFPHGEEKSSALVRGAAD